jgi:hypothetical protein
VLGEHPATYLAAALLSAPGKLRIVHATLPNERSVDRLALLNPRLFDLSPLLEPLRHTLDLTPLHGLQFLDDDGVTRSEFHSKSIVSHVASYQAFRAALIKIAQEQGVQLLNPKQLEILRLDESGAEVAVGKTMLRPTMLIVGGTLPEPQQKLLGLPESWGPGILHRYSFLRLKAAKWATDLSAHPLAAMSLDLAGTLSWSWFTPHEGQVQLAVEQPVEAASNGSGVELLRHWGEVLRKHGRLKETGTLPMGTVQTLDLPFAGALAHEGVANRTLLIGPAGGFFSACGEDLYPNCWSAIYAADAAKKALKERHLQDALQPYRQRWRTTLGNYLRGPQQNLRFLLPLVYRNQVMTNRLAESILLGKSVVR